MAESPTPAAKIRGLKSSRLAQYGVILLLFGAAWLLFIVLLSSDKAPKTQNQAGPGADPGKVSLKAITAPGEVVTDAQRWLYKAGDDITVLKGRVEQSESLNRELTARLAAVEAERKKAPVGGVPTGFPPGTPSMAPATPRFVPPPPVPAPRKTLDTPGAETPRASPDSMATVPFAPVVGIGRIVVSGAAEASAGRPLTSTRAAAPSNPSKPIGKDAAREVGKTYLPIGFVKARLLGGLDAPTSGAAQSSPMPVFLRLEDLAWLPNHWRAQVKDCLATADGYGDISSERAYFRLGRLSCIRQDGRVLEQNVSGSIYGEDGKIGLRGRLVTKQGQVLANALLAGVVSGIGRGVVFQSSTVGTTALGTVVTDPDPGKEYQAGIGQGVSNAMDRLAQYYISLADKTHPVVEIDAGRSVEIGFTKGTTLDVPLPEDPDLLAMRTTPRRGRTE